MTPAEREATPVGEGEALGVGATGFSGFGVDAALCGALENAGEGASIFGVSFCTGRSSQSATRSSANRTPPDSSQISRAARSEPLAFAVVFKGTAGSSGSGASPGAGEFFSSADLRRAASRVSFSR